MTKKVLRPKGNERGVKRKHLAMMRSRTIFSTSTTRRRASSNDHVERARSRELVGHSYLVSMTFRNVDDVSFSVSESVLIFRRSSLLT